MKLCIPTMDNQGLNAPISDHFGKAPTFTIFDTETSKITVFVNESDHMGGTGSPPDHIAKYGVEMVLASGAGAKAISMLNDHGIKVYVGNKGTVSDALENWKNKTLKEANPESACKNHH